MGWLTPNSSLGDTPDVVTKAQQEGDSGDKPVRPEPAIKSEDFLQDAPSDAEDEKSPHKKLSSNFDSRSQRQNLPRLDTNVPVGRALRATNPDPISPIIGPEAVSEHVNFTSQSIGGPSVSETQKDTFYY